ncbi:hypothetical protein [Avibacterium avium]|uniref:hypothetical protein n=1 Tax=Avibacterium avium TaxID=751 RepID=UPI003BF897C9
MLKLILFMFSPFIAIYVWFVFNAIGWVNVGIVFSLAIAFGLISIIRENKTKTLKVSRLTAVVEALPHLSRLANHLLITVKRTSTMKTITKTTALMAGTFPIAFTSAMAEVQNG